jgi:hypothetical protein
MNNANQSTSITVAEIIAAINCLIPDFLNGAPSRFRFDNKLFLSMIAQDGDGTETLPCYVDYVYRDKISYTTIGLLDNAPREVEADLVGLPPEILKRILLHMMKTFEDIRKKMQPRRT